MIMPRDVCCLASDTRFYVCPVVVRSADLMEVGDVGLSVQEMHSQVALWAFMSLPMLMSSDLRKLLSSSDAATLVMLSNEGILALQRDPLGYQGRRLSGYTPSPPPPTPAPPTPSLHEVVVAACRPGESTQQWKVEDDGAIVHVATGLALTIVDCVSKRTPGVGATVGLAHRSTAGSCKNGTNQLWQFNSNGSITSRMDSSCLDRNARGDYVQAHFCVRDPEGSGGPPNSEAWQVDGPHDNVTIRFSKSVWNQCMQSSAQQQQLALPAPGSIRYRPPVGGSEIWEKQLSGGDVAILLLNRADCVANISAQFVDIPGVSTNHTGGSNQTALKVYDVWAAQDDGVARGGVWRMVPAHGVAVLRLSHVARSST
jgi:hypothetical protein